MEGRGEAEAVSNVQNKIAARLHTMSGKLGRGGVMGMSGGGWGSGLVAILAAMVRPISQ